MMRTTRYLEKEEVMLVDIMSDNRSQSRSPPRSRRVSRQESRDSTRDSQRNGPNQRKKSKVSSQRRERPEVNDSEDQKHDEDESPKQNGQNGGDDDNQSDDEQSEDDEVDPDMEWSVLKWKNLKRKKKAITMSFTANAVMDVVEGADNKIMCSFSKINKLCLGKCTKGTEGIDASKLIEQFISIVQTKGTDIDLQAQNGMDRQLIALAILKGLDAVGLEPVDQSVKSLKSKIFDMTPLEQMVIEFKKKAPEVVEEEVVGKVMEKEEKVIFLQG